MATQVSDGIPDPIGIQRKRWKGRLGRAGCHARGRGCRRARHRGDGRNPGRATVGRPPSPFGIRCGGQRGTRAVGTHLLRGCGRRRVRRDGVRPRPPVTLTAQDGRVVEVESTHRQHRSTRRSSSMAWTTSWRDRRCGDDARSRERTGSWLRDAYAGCGSDCGAELQTVAVSLTRDSQSISLTLQGSLSRPVTIGDAAASRLHEGDAPPRRSGRHRPPRRLRRRSPAAAGVNRAADATVRARRARSPALPLDRQPGGGSRRSVQPASRTTRPPASLARRSSSTDGSAPTAGSPAPHATTRSWRSPTAWPAGAESARSRAAR